jgi:hypothetical protein
MHAMSQRLQDAERGLDRKPLELLADARAEITRLRPVVAKARDVVSVWRQWERRIHGSTVEAPAIPIKALAAAVDVLALAPAAAALLEEGMPEPCQPIGCDNGHHLNGCVFAAVDGEEER